MPQRLLILCTGNSCRSQMAEAWWNALGGGAWTAHSAGSKPAACVHPMAIQAMSEVGIDLSSHKSKPAHLFEDETFALVVTVCDNAREACPAFPGAARTLHWPFDDPALAVGDEEQRMAEFRRVRDEIGGRIRRFLKEGE